MLGSSPLQRRVDDRATLDHSSFLNSHRALASCTREFARLAAGVAQGVAAMQVSGIEDKVEVRLSPERCIVQLGPVALTVAWLRSTLDSVADGQLLAIVWRGVVAPRGEHLPERPRAFPAPLAATVLWEEVLVAVGTNEASWAWQPLHAGPEGYSSEQLAIRYVEQLRLARAACRSASTR